MPKRDKEVSTNQKERKTWDTSRMAKAIKIVREEKMGYMKAANKFGVPRSTLYRLVKTNVPDENIAAITKMEGKTVLSEKLEDELVVHCQHMESLFYSITGTDIRQMAYQLAVRNNISNPFDSKIAGKGWLRRFKKRHKNMLSIIRKPKLLDFSTKKMSLNFSTLSMVSFCGTNFLQKESLM